MLSAWVTLASEESVTWTLKLAVSKTVGVPCIWAEVLVLDVIKLKPAGRLPEIIDHVKGAGAPAALTNAGP